MEKTLCGLTVSREERRKRRKGEREKLSYMEVLSHCYASGIRHQTIPCAALRWLQQGSYPNCSKSGIVNSCPADKMDSLYELVVISLIYVLSHFFIL